jgi:hypothetical protein
MKQSVARGLSETSHRPAGLRSSPMPVCANSLRALRARAGINPLATIAFPNLSADAMFDHRTLIARRPLLYLTKLTI